MLVISPIVIPFPNILQDNQDMIISLAFLLLSGLFLLLTGFFNLRFLGRIIIASILTVILYLFGYPSIGLSDLPLLSTIGFAFINAILTILIATLVIKPKGASQGTRGPVS